MVRLSKSKVMSALQCAKRLHLEVHRPELREVSASTEAIFATGHKVGAMACEVLGHRDAILIERDPGVQANLDRTAELMAANTPAIYEAALQHNDVLVYIDILRRDADAWHLIEVKSTSRVKPEHLKDCAVQTWVLQGAGHEVARVSLAHLDNTFVYLGGGDYTDLFHLADVTDDVHELLPSVPSWVTHATEASAETEPEMKVGEHCSKPYVCSFHNHCWPTRTTYPVSGLGGKKKKLAALVHEGYADIREVPLIKLRSPSHLWIHRVTNAGTPDLRDDATTFARELPYPRHYLDFETINPAIPVWPGTRPFEAVPFQWSCHIEDAPGAIRHVEFLDVSGQVPIRALAESLIVSLGDTGPILTYSSYEKRVIKGLARRFPDLAPALTAFIDRLQDMLPVAKHNYYHPAMLGSWSIKAILPTVAPDMKYGELGEVQDGVAAGNAYLEAIDPGTTEIRRETLRQSMLTYCRFDTEAMVRLMQFFASGGEP